MRTSANRPRFYLVRSLFVSTRAGLRLGRLVDLDCLVRWALSSAATSRSPRARLRASVRKACARGDSTQRRRRAARLRAKNRKPPTGSVAALASASQALRTVAVRPHKCRVRRNGYRRIRAQRRALPPCASRVSLARERAVRRKAQLLSARAIPTPIPH